MQAVSRPSPESIQKSPTSPWIAPRLRLARFTNVVPERARSKDCVQRHVLHKDCSKGSSSSYVIGARSPPSSARLSWMHWGRLTQLSSSSPNISHVHSNRMRLAGITLLAAALGVQLAGSLMTQMGLVPPSMVQVTVWRVHSSTMAPLLPRRVTRRHSALSTQLLPSLSRSHSGRFPWCHLQPFCRRQRHRRFLWCHLQLCRR